MAAEQGDSDCQTILGNMYREGEGVKRDYAEAAKWYQLAAAQGDEEAQESLEEIRDLLKRG